MIEKIFLFILFITIWLIFGLILSSIFSKFKWYNEIMFVYKIKKPKKYELKVTPIYEICESEWETGRFLIKKWSLRYYEPEVYELLSPMLIYPIKILKYGYQFEDSVFFCFKKDLEYVSGTLEENYERIFDEQNKKYQEEVRIKNSHNKIIGDLNKTFLENFE